MTAKKRDATQAPVDLHVDAPLPGDGAADTSAAMATNSAGDVVERARAMVALGDQAASADVAALIEEATTAHADAAASAVSMTAARTDLLMEGDDHALLDHDTAQRRCENDRDRLGIFLDRLQAQLNATKEREAADFLAAKVAAAEEKKAEALKLLDEYQEHAARIAEILVIYAEAEKACEAANVRTIQSDLRFKPSWTAPDTEVEVSGWAWEDSKGVTHTSRHNPKPGAGVGGSMPVFHTYEAGEHNNIRRTNWKEAVPGGWHHSRHAPVLTDVVSLPGVLLDAPDYWKGAKIELRS